jgi:hypothetical protein
VLNAADGFQKQKLKKALKECYDVPAAEGNSAPKPASMAKESRKHLTWQQRYTFSNATSS